MNVDGTRQTGVVVEVLPGAAEVKIDQTGKTTRVPFGKLTEEEKKPFEMGDRVESTKDGRKGKILVIYEVLFALIVIS